MEPEPHSWDRQPNEPNRWYQRFTFFRLQGPARSIESTWANEAKRSKAKRPNSRWYAIVKLWSWWDRAADWDKYLSDQANAQAEIDWQSRIMGKSEVLAGLSDISRGDLADVMAITPSGFTIELMIDDGHGNKIINPKTKLIKKIKQKVTTCLAKKESDEDREIIETEVELYSAHDAYKDLGRFHGLFKDQNVNFTFDPSMLSDAQLERLAKGEDLFTVLMGSKTS